MKKTLWLLIGSEGKSENAENSGMLLLCEEDGHCSYEIADGNNRVTATGTVVNTALEGHMVLDDIVLGIARMEGLSSTQYVELRETGDEAEKNFHDLTDNAGAFFAVRNSDAAGDDEMWIVIRTEDDAVMDTFPIGESGAAYDRMCVLNAKKERDDVAAWVNTISAVKTDMIAALVSAYADDWTELTEEGSDGNLPMWGTMWSFDDGYNEEWVRRHVDDMSDMGFRVYESKLYGLYFGLDGGGYDFYEAHWIPLYRLWKRKEKYVAVVKEGGENSDEKRN